MTDMHVRVSAAWKRVIQPHVKVSGVWKGVNAAYVRVSGVWKQFYAGIATLTDALDPNHAVDTDVGTAYFRFNADGTVDKVDASGTNQINASTDWVIPNAAATTSYQIKWDQVSGDAPTVNDMPVEGTWYALSTRRIGAFAGGNLEEGIVTVSIRFNGGAVIDTADYEWSAIDTS